MTDANTPLSGPDNPNAGSYGVSAEQHRRRLAGHRQASRQRLEQTVGKPPPPGSVPRPPRRSSDEPLRGGQ